MYARTIDEYPKINPFHDSDENNRVISWWSGGVASAVTCVLMLEKYENVSIAFCDTSLEHPDTYRFMNDFENKFGIKIDIIKSSKFNEPEDVWRRYSGMNFAHGAPCSNELKKQPRIKYQKKDTDFAQAFGFDYGKKEMRRATNMLVNNPDINPIFPLIVEKYSRDKIFKKIKDLGFKIPKAYEYFQNNNCIGDFESEKGGCIQGGIGYWQLIKEKFPKKFEYTANLEHELSIKKNKPITICRDQRKKTRGNKLFLKKCEAFPEVEDISVIKGKRPVVYFECNGFCSTQEPLF